MKKSKQSSSRSRKREHIGAGLSVDLMAAPAFLFILSGFLLISFKEANKVDITAILMGAGLPLFIMAQLWVSRRLFPHVDSLMFLLSNFLCCLGLLLLYRLKPEQALGQLLSYAVGTAAFWLGLLLGARWKWWGWLCWAGIGAALILMMLPVAFGKEVYGAKNWISVPVLGGFQPSELVKPVFVICLSYFLTRFTPIKKQWPAAVMVLGCIGALVLQKDLGTMLIYFVVCIALFYSATSNLALTGAALGTAALGATASYFLFDHVRVRVAVWQDPFALYDGKGYQTVHSLIALGSAGLFGQGLGLGTPLSIPVNQSDFIFAVLYEQFGVVSALLVLGIYAMLIARGAQIAQRQREAFPALGAMGMIASMGFQAFLIVGGVINMIPLTGVTLPFVSLGGSSLISCMAMVGLIEGWGIRAGEMDEAAFRRAQEDAR